MSRWAFELHTRPLEPREVMAQFEPAGGLCWALGATTVEAFFGWGCVEDEELWQPRSLSPDELGAFAVRGVANGIYRPGESEIVVDHPAGRFEIRFWHEADLHFECSERELIDVVAEAWTELGLDPRAARS